MKKGNKEAGSALLSVLLVVALMSIAALSMMDLTLTGIQKAKAADGRSRVAWQIIGAEQAGLLGVQRLWAASSGEFREGVSGLGEEFVTEANGAQISTHIEDASNCFNLNSLFLVEEDDFASANDGFVAEEGDPNTQAETNYRLLLRAAGFAENEADRLTDALLDWLDTDNIQRPNGAEDNYYANLQPSYRTSGALLAELSELRAIRDYNKDVVEQLETLICVRNVTESSALNINTLKPEQFALLSMAFSGELSSIDAQNVISDRPFGGWASVEEMLSIASIQRIDPEFYQIDLLSTQSNYLTLNGEILNDPQGVEFSTLYLLSEGMPARIVSRSFGAM